MSVLTPLSLSGWLNRMAGGVDTASQYSALAADQVTELASKSTRSQICCNAGFLNILSFECLQSIKDVTKEERLAT